MSSPEGCHVAAAAVVAQRQVHVPTGATLVIETGIGESPPFPVIGISLDKKKAPVIAILLFLPFIRPNIRFTDSGTGCVTTDKS